MSTAIVGLSSLFYAAPVERIGLSPAAAHEQVERLRAADVVRATTGDLDEPTMGTPLLALVPVDPA